MRRLPGASQDRQRMTIEETLAELVGINSVSAGSNTEIINFLAARAEAIGFRVRRFPYADARGVEKLNMVAIAGADSFDERVELALVGHTDTVNFLQKPFIFALFSILQSL
jgi:acetylornithine deacetylase/succinyl-diaminopimelate desuccinylase-like protein